MRVFSICGCCCVQLLALTTRIPTYPIVHTLLKPSTPASQNYPEKFKAINLCPFLLSFIALSSKVCLPVFVGVEKIRVYILRFVIHFF